MLRTLINEYLNHYFSSEPVAAARLGLHEFDGQLPDYSPARVNERVRFVRNLGRRLDALPAPPAGSLEWLDYRLLRRATHSTELHAESLREWRTHPLFYSAGCDVSGYVKRDYAPLEDRARAAVAHLSALPDFLHQAQANLEGPLARVPVQTGVTVFRGHHRFVRTQLGEQLAAASAKTLADLHAATAAAGDALERIASYLENRLADEPAPFAIGAERFAALLSTDEAVDVDLARLQKVGEDDLARNLEEFEQTAKQIGSHRTPLEVFRDTGAPPAAEMLIPTARELLKELREFVVREKLVSIPDDLECRVAETPPYERWAFAMLDAPGPFEVRSPDAYYYITPPDPAWPQEKQREWLTQFESSILTLISIHEAWPGHFLHWLHTRNAPTPMTQVADAYSFWEAWAHYCEEMVLDAGFGAGNARLRLAQLHEALIRNVRFIAAIGMHTGEMSVGEAAEMFRRKAFMEEKPAQNEAERGTFDPGYLNYTLGKLMLKKLREDVRAERGDAFDLREFHDDFLAYGAPPVPFVRRMLLPESGDDVV